MIDPKWFFNTLTENGIEFYTGVPDSLLKNICSYIADNTASAKHVIAANEGGAMAVAIGYHLATKKLPLVYMQNSGLGNATNPILSLLDQQAYSIPALMMIGWRGEPSVSDEPQHAKQGRVTLSLLDAMEIPYEVLGPELEQEEISTLIRVLVFQAMKENRCCALVIKKNTFVPYELQSTEEFKRPMNREQVISLIAETLLGHDVVVSTTGVASRELFECRAALGQSHKQDFLTIGGMGHASQIALGIALSKPDRQVFCLDGDGAFLMHMGGVAISATSGLANYRHIIFNNAAHDSVGGQPTVGDHIDIVTIAKGLKFEWVERAVNAKEIKSALLRMREVDGTALLEIQICKGFRTNLGRPTTSPTDNKSEFMEFVADVL
jgi:phosphonopyruvate decarboxylase